MGKKLFVLWALLMLALPSRAQTFFEVTYTDPDDGEEYVGLMIYYDDENCKMRLVTAELIEKDEVYESNYEQGVMPKESRDDVGVMFYAPEEEGFPTFVWVWEKDDASDINEKPYCTFDVEDTDSYFEVEYFQEISLSDMDQEYIEQFYTSSEKEYKMLMRGVGMASPQPTSTLFPTSAIEDNSVPTFHLLVVANTEVSDIGTACKRDLLNLRSEFGAIAKVLGMEYDEQIVAEDNYGKANAERMIRNVEAGPNDVLMFVYTGHGFRFDDQRDYYPNIDLSSSSYEDPSKNYASMSDIYEALSQKGARLTIVLSDCCNTKLGMNTPMLNSNSLFSRSNSNFDISKLKSLFLGSSGKVRATASSPNEVSWCGVNGGFFLLSFIESLRHQISPLQEGKPSWDKLVSDAIVSARKKSTSNEVSKAQNGLKQVNVR